MSIELETITKFYEQAFQTLNGKRSVPEIEVNFYPYIGINHTIRVRNGKVFVRISEMLRAAPTEVQDALAFILVAKLLRKKIPSAAREIYGEFIKSGEIREKALENKRAKGRKIISSATGEIYNLEEIFVRLNQNYFSNRLKKPVLSWSARKTFRRLGHHDEVHETIIVSKSLDDKKVPKYVVEFVVFHEMLHIFHPTKHRNGRRYNHTPAFRRDEEKFEYFEEAEDWIERNVKMLKRGARKKIK
jgi:hypothetical protein